MRRGYSHLAAALVLAGFLAGSLGLAACSTTHYRVTTQDGQVYVSAGQPRLDEDTKTYHLRQLDGKRVILNQKDVREIKQED